MVSLNNVRRRRFLIALSVTLASATIFAADASAGRGSAVSQPPRESRGGGELEPIAVFPVSNISRSAAPLDEIRHALSSKLGSKGLMLLDDGTLEDFMRRNRVRYTGGLADEMGRALAEETGAGAVLIVSLDLYDDSALPRAAISARLILLGLSPRIIWMDSAAQAGDESPGFLGQGRIETPEPILDTLTSRIAESAALFLSDFRSQRESRRTAQRPARRSPRSRFRPQVFFRSPGVQITGPGAGRVAVLPFANESTTDNAGEIVADRLVRHLVDTGADVIEPGEVRQKLLEARLIQEGGPSVPQADLLRQVLNAELVLFGDVSSYREADPGQEPAALGFSIRALDAGSRKVVWSSFSSARGDQGVFFFGATRVPTAHELASEMVSAVVSVAENSYEKVPPSVRVVKTASPAKVPETGGDVTFEVMVENIGVTPARISSLVDSQDGDLNGLGSCSVPQDLQRSGSRSDSYACAFTAFVAGDFPGRETTIVTATVVDGVGNSIMSDGAAAVAFLDVLPAVSLTSSASPAAVPETGGEAMLTITVTNGSLEPGEIVAFADETIGDLDGRGDCAVPQSLAPAGQPGDQYSCSFPVQMGGDFPGSESFTAKATVSDRDGNQAEGETISTVSYEDVKPAATVAYDASLASVPETGGAVRYTVTVSNVGDESASLTKLADDLLGDLNGKGDCSLPRILAPFRQPGATFRCSVSAEIAGDFPESKINSLTVTYGDDDGNTMDSAASAAVLFDDVLPDAAVSVRSEPASVPETGGEVTYEVTVTNSSEEAGSLTDLVDHLAGSLGGRGSCAIPQDLAPAGQRGDRYRCTFMGRVVGDFPGSEQATFTATVGDDDGNSVNPSAGTETVFEDVQPEATVGVRAVPPTVPDSGGEVTITVTVRNASAEAAKLIALEDDVFGGLDGRGTCTIPQDLAAAGQPGDSYSCSHTGFSSNISAGERAGSVTATVADDEANERRSSGRPNLTWKRDEKHDDESDGS